MKNSRMQTVISKIKGLSKKRIALIVVGLMVVGGIVSGVLRKNTKETLVVAEKGRVEEEVLMTGKVESHTEVHLGFERSGKVVSSQVDVGSRVNQGQVLAALDSSDLRADLQKADANIRQAQIELNTLNRKSTLSEQTASQSLINNIKDAYIKSDDAIHNDVDQFFKNPGTSSIEFDPSFTNNGTLYYGGLSQETKGLITTDRKNIEQMLIQWERDENLLNASSNLDAAYLKAEQNLMYIRGFLDRVASAINSLVLTDFTYTSTIQGYKTTIASDRTKIQAALSNLIATKEKYNNAPKAVQSGTTDDVLAEEARLEALQADRAAIEANISKTIIRAPISGVVTEAEAKVGEIVSPSTSLITVISDQDLQIEANLSEVNVAKVRVGNTVAVEFDAIPGVIYEGVVRYVDPAAKMVDGVATYKVTVEFKNTATITKEGVVKSGLTANLKVLTKAVDNVVKIPAYAVEKRSNGSFVKIVSGKQRIEKEVTVGLRGKDGTVEILSGVASGDQLIISK